MIRFRTLGTLDLTDSQGREIRSLLRSPKLLALLSYLAMARPPGFHRRDTLVALLWPELDHAHARNALRQAVHTLREALGRGVVQGRGEEELGIDQQCLWCDVRELEMALDGEKPEQALELYGGELLGGLHVSGAPDFERWLDEERDHVRRRACEAARLLIDRDEAAGNPAGAARWARRLTELSPSDEPAVRRLIQLLHAAGDRAGAVLAYEDFERRLARDLELEPSTGTRSLVESVRAQPQSREAVELRPPVMEKAELAFAESSAKTVSPEQPRPTVKPTRKRSAALIALLLTGLLTAGWFMIGGELAGRSADSASNPKRLVVLPFANLGPAEDAYFAAGVTEELTARLAAVDRLRVIGSTTANRYKSTTKSIPEIGKELSVSFIVEGSVRWQKSAGGQARVRVTPQLVSTKDGTHLWAQVYDEPFDEIFRVQSDIAQKVVRALDLSVLEPERRRVEAAPTRSVEAYDYFLRGNNYVRRGNEERFMRSALQMYQKAVEVDPKFALAYALLSRVHSRMYLFHYDRSETRLTMAKQAVDRAFELEPGLPEAHHSLGAYYFIGLLDYERGLQEFAIAEARRPNDSELFLAKAALRKRQGKFRESLADYAKAQALDPGSAAVAQNYGQAHDLLRDHREAEAQYDRALALAPDQRAPYFWKSGLYLRWYGNTRKARAVLDEAQKVQVPLLVLDRVRIEIFDRRYEAALSQLSSEAPEVMSGQFHFTPRALLYAQVYELMQRRDVARSYYDSTRTLVSSELRKHPDDPRLHSALGIAYAGLRLKREAINEGRKAVELLPISQEAYRGYFREWDLARIYVMVGEHDAAIERLKYLLSIPGLLTAAWLRVDPVWDPLRSHRDFRRLVDR
jgi:serine/threonine-protein kinase